MSAHKLVIKDAVRQILGRVVSAFCGFLVIKIISPYLGQLRLGDYSTILKYFAIFSALADFGLYVIAIKRMGVVKDEFDKGNKTKKDLETLFGKFVGTRVLIMSVVYLFALLLAYFLPAYSSNQFLIWGLPIGMIFSAGFMTAGIIQIPLQLFRKMEKLSIALILARVSQLLILVASVFFLFKRAEICPAEEFCLQSPEYSIPAFLVILLSVFASIFTQGIYVRIKSNKYLKLKIKFDFKFIKNMIFQNFQYGWSYFLSSFHTLIVLIFLSNFFPTSEGFGYTGIWALGLMLIEIFLIVPSALGNSMLHKVGAYTTEHKRKSFGNFFSMIFWIGAMIFMNFLLFNTDIVNIISSAQYIGTGLLNPGTNTILPFLAVVLWLSFLKQVFNYLFVATEKQNLLLRINLVGVAIGIAVGLYLIPKYNIVGGIVTQILLELLFVLGAFFVGRKYKIFPKVPWIKLLKICGILLSGIGVSWFLRQFVKTNNVHLLEYRFLIEAVFAGLFVGGMMLWRKKLLIPPKFQKKILIFVGSILFVSSIVVVTEFPNIMHWITTGDLLNSFDAFWIYASCINFMMVVVSLPHIKYFAKGLTTGE